MKNSSSRKGFTVVELVIVIAVIAVLAAVLIPTFSSLIKKANDSAYLQERTNQQIADLAEKVENQDFLSWADLEAKLAEELAKIDTVDKTELEEAATTAVAEFEKAIKKNNTALTEAQVKAIVEKALEGQLTSAQVEGIVNAAVAKIPEVGGSTLSANDVKTIVDNAVAGLNKETGITKEEMEAAVSKAISEAVKDQAPELTEEQIKNIVNNALAGFGHGYDLTASEVKAIIENAMSGSKEKADVLAAEEMTEVITAANATEFTAAVEALTAAGYNVSALTPIREGYIFSWDDADDAIVCVPDNGSNEDIVEEGAGLVVADVASVADFNKAISNGNTIKLTTDLADIGAVVVPAGKEVTIDLSGNDISTGARDASSHQYALNVYGTVTLTNGTINARGVEVRDGGKLVIGEGVTINAVDPNGGAALWIYAGAEVEINSGTLTALNGLNDNNNNNVEPCVIYNEAKVTINGGMFEANSENYAIKNAKATSELVINGGTFKSNRGVIAADEGTITINGGTFIHTGESSLGGYVVYAFNGTVNVTGGTFTNNGTGNKFCVDGAGTGSITVDGDTLTAGESK